jgi:WD40 repeat protein
VTDLAAAATPAGDGSPAAADAAVQQAVEAFVEAHGSGDAPDAAAFAARYPDAIRPRVLAQCREYLAFDGLLGPQPALPPAPPAGGTPGRALGDFVIQEELGRGGMGVVYLAWQQSLRRRVALKVMASGLVLSARHVERFRREAAAAAQLHHPAIVAVHALVEHDGTFALAMDYVAGRNLADILDDLRLANGDGATTVEGTLGLAADKGWVAECAMFVAELAGALAVAHGANVVHRDLKPRNLMLDERRQVRLLDFGLAKSLDDGSISLSGEITGTAHYLSPEQTLGKRVAVDHRADIWALGVILYEMLTLRRPFDGRNLQQIVYAICFQEPTPPQRVNHKVPRDLAIVCLKALEKDPTKRYQTAAELRADLQRFLRWEPVLAKPAGALTRAAKWVRRHRVETAVAVLAVLAGLVALLVDARAGRRADELIARAKDAAAQERHDAATALVAQALALRNDEPTRTLHQMFSEQGRRVQAEAAKLALDATNAIERDRAAAIELALQAVALHASATTRSAVLDALGSGSVVRELRDRTAPRPPRLVGARWSPDGRHAVLLGYGGHAQLWDTATARPGALLRGHAADTPEPVPVVDAVFSNQQRLVTAGADGTLRCWRTADGSLERTLALPGPATQLRGSRDGARVLVLTHRRTDRGFASAARVWDAQTMSPLGDAVELPQLAVACAIAADGAHAAVACGDDTVHVWPTDGSAVPRVTAAGERVRALAFAPDGALLAIASGSVVQLLRLRDHARCGSARHSLAVTSLAFASSGTRLLTGSRDGTARLWRLAPGAADGAIELIETATLLGHTGPVDHVAFDANDVLALTGTGGQAGQLCLFDVAAGGVATATPVRRYEVGGSIDSVEYAANGAAVLARAGDRALVWDFGAARGVVAMRHGVGVGAVAFDAGGALVVTASAADERVRAWSATDGKVAWTTPPVRGVPQTGIDVDAASGRVASWGRRGRTVHVRDAANGEVLHELDARCAVHAARLLARGTRLLTAGDRDGRGSVTVWDTATWQPVLELAPDRAVDAADASADGALLARRSSATTGRCGCGPSPAARRAAS